MTGNDDDYHDLPEAPIRFCQQAKSYMIDLIEFEYDSYMSIQHNYQPQMVLRTELLYPGIGQTENPGRSPEVINWSTQFQHRINHSYDYIPSIWAKYTYLSLRLHLQL